MSSALRISVIAEGDTDKIALDAFLEAILGHADFVSTLIQPETSRAFGHGGEYGGGWKGVHRKCVEIQQRGGLDAGGYLANADLMIIHLDGEVAEEPEVRCSAPCPPPGATADALRGEVWSWIGEAAHPRVVVAIPMRETEAWIFAALRPQDRLVILCEDELRSANAPCLECRDKPSHLLAGGAPRLLKSGKKNRLAYQDARPAMVTGWAHARRLSQAQRFDDEVALSVTRLKLQGSI